MGGQPQGARGKRPQSGSRGRDGRRVRRCRERPGAGAPIEIAGDDARSRPPRTPSAPATVRARGRPGSQRRRIRGTRRPRGSRRRTGAIDPAPGPARIGRPPSISASPSAPAAWSGATWVSAIASIAPPRSSAIEMASSSPGPVGSPGSISTNRRAADQVRRDRLARDTAAGRHHDPGDRRATRRRRVGSAERAGRQALAHLVDRPGALGDAAASRSSGSTSRGRPPPSMPAPPSGVSQAWPATSSPSNETRAPAGSIGGEEPGIETARQDRRRDPARERDQQIRAERQVQLRRRSRRSRPRRQPARSLGDPAIELGMPEGGLPPGARARRPRARPRAARRSPRTPRGWPRCRPRARVSGSRSPPSAVAASVATTTDRATSRGSRVGGVHPAAREDVHVRGERHRRRPAGQQDLEPGAPGSEQDDGRGEPGDDLGVGHPGEGRRRDGRLELGAQRLRIRDRQPADEPAADVGGRPAVDGDAVEQQRDALDDGSAETATTWFGRNPSVAAASSAWVAGSVRVADDRDLGHGREREVHRRQPLGEARSDSAPT